MTDYRRTEQELWDEDASADDDDKTLVIAPRALQTAVREANSQASLPSRPTPPARAGDSVEEVARFIAEPGTLRPSAERELDAPRRSLAALELLDADEGAEATDVRPAPLPPALPADAKPPASDLASSSTLVLGTPGSARNDITERVTTIPRTHPMANSIAPGGSPLTARPAPRRSLRWQAALGVAALLLIGGASRLLQSRGEHHAASGTRSDEQENTPAEPRRVAPVVTPQPLMASTPSISSTPAAAQPASSAAEASASVEEGGAEQARQVSARAAQTAARAEIAAQAETEARVRAEARAEARRVQKVAQEEAAARRIHVGVGGAQLLIREQGNDSAEHGEPDRAAIVQALTALTPRLQECVGDDHGIADVILTVRAPGVVSHALVQGAYAGSDKGSCIARTLRSVSLPSLEAPISHVSYPFQL